MATTLPDNLIQPARLTQLPPAAAGYQARGAVPCTCGKMHIQYAWQPDPHGAMDLETAYITFSIWDGYVLHRIERCPACRRRLSYQWLAEALEQAGQS